MGERATQGVTENGHTGVFKILFESKRISPTFEDSYLLRMARNNNQVKLFLMLMDDDRDNPLAYNNYPFKAVSINGNIEMVKIA